ncbi:MAG: Ig-like domain repeat protein, partial [Methanobrevibacter sp.]|nr:Ig-like domain repeat protein [Methanobrevibacter sp.]
ITITPTVLDEDNNIVTEGDVKYSDENGVDLGTKSVTESLEISTFGNGTHTIYAEYLGVVDKYVGNSTFSTVTVSKRDISLSITVSNAVYPENALITITTDVAGTYNITINGQSEEKQLIAGTNTWEISTLPVQNGYVANVSFTGNSTYNKVNKSATFNVTSGSVGVVIEIADVVYPDYAVAVVNANVSGQYVIKINGVDYSRSLTAGVEERIVVNELIAAGTGYEANVTSNIDNYAVVVNSTTFDVNKGSVKVDINVSSVDYPDVPVVTVLANVTGRYDIVVGNQVISGFEITEANVVIEVPGINQLLPGDSYSASITSVDANYAVASDLDEFSVNLGKIDLSIVVDDVVYPGSVIAYVTANVTGDYVIEIAGFDYSRPLTAGERTEIVLTETVDAGTDYVASVTSNIDNYAVVVNSTTFDVNKGKIDLTIDVKDTVYNNKVVANVSASLTGKYNITIENETKEVDLTAGVYKLVTFDTIWNASSVDYKATISVVESDNYNETNLSDTFVINKANINLTIVVDNTVYPNKPIAIVFADVAGKYIVNIAGTDQEIELAAGETKEVEALQSINVISNQRVTIHIDASTNYNAADNSTKYNVTRGNPNFTLDLSPDVIYVDDNIIFTPSADDANSKVNYYENDQLIGFTNSVIPFSINTLTNGTHHIVAKYEGTINYMNDTYELDVVINKVPINLSVEVENKNYGETVIATVISSAPGTYNVTVNNKNYSVIILNGQNRGTTGPIDTLNAGNNYEAKVIFEGTNKYAANENTTKFNITPAESEVSFNVDNANPIFNTDVVILDLTSTPADAEIKFYDNDDFITLVEGKIVGLTAGEHNITAKFEGNNNYNASNHTVKINVAKASTSIIFDVDDTNPNYGDNLSISNILVTPNVDGEIEFYDNGNLIALVDGNVVGLTAGEHNITAKFCGNDNYNESNYTIAVNVNRADIQLNISVDNVEYSNKVIAKVLTNVNGTYTITINGEEHIENLIAGVLKEIIAYDIFEAGNDYLAKIEIVQSNNYNSANNETKFNVTKAQSTMDLSVDNNTPIYNNPITFTVNINQDDVTGRILLYDGETLIGNNTVNDNTFIISNLTGGKHSIRAVYAGDNNYNSSYDDIEVNVDKANVTLTISVNPTVYPEGAIVTVKSNADIDVIIK